MYGETSLLFVVELVKLHLTTYHNSSKLVIGFVAKRFYCDMVDFLQGEIGESGSEGVFGEKGSPVRN